MKNPFLPQPAFPTLKNQNFCHLKEPQISHLAQVNSALCEIRTTLLHLCEIRTNQFSGAKFAHPTPLCEFLGFSPLPSQSQAFEPHFFAPLWLRPEEALPHGADPVRAPLDAPPHLPDSAHQSRYYTRRAAATPVAPTQIPARSPPTKKAKTSELGESSRAARDSQSQPPPTRRPILASSPIEGNSDCRARAFHDEAYFDHYVL
ncbi:hypothetical protein CK203_101707 [Vitis vinifera]|uniref:Uncharacterized protein n=1 Tax=Vitis vinifera TaxID=29760 RepID=A0A438DQQ5_VITVI|nr:hypothetical protein CK203_101707 [Vitis vinifera]